MDFGSHFTYIRHMSSKARTRETKKSAKSRGHLNHARIQFSPQIIVRIWSRNMLNEWFFQSNLQVIALDRDLPLQGDFMSTTTIGRSEFLSLSMRSYGSLEIWSSFFFGGFGVGFGFLLESLSCSWPEPGRRVFERSETLANVSGSMR